MPCPLCDDTGWKTIEIDGASRVARCDCWRDRQVAKLLAEAGIPPRYRKCTLDTFVTYPNERLLKALDRTKAFVAAYPVADKGLFFIGPPGIGKTHLAVAMLSQIIRTKGAQGLYVDTRELLRLIRDTYNPVKHAAEMDLLVPVMRAQILVLDDLGAERPTEWVEETMNLIVNTRYNKRLLTVFTSNYEDVPGSDEDTTYSLIERVGFRIHSRLREMCEFLEFEGADYRDLPPNGTAEDLLTMWKLHPRRKTLPGRTKSVAKARLREGRTDLKWPGGRAGT
jgi:DNA replication protein DnaC